MTWNTLGLICGVFLIQQTQGSFKDDHTSLHGTPTFGLGACRSQKCEATTVAIQRGEKYLNTLEKASHQESLVDLLWGNACHTNALSKVSKDCRELQLAEKSRLALLLMYCQLVVQGESRSNPRLQCNAGEPLKVCVNRLTDRENALYIEMLSNIDTICLYIQNQEFEKYAEHMLNVLIRGSSLASQSIQVIQRDLDSIRSDLLHQSKMQAQMSMNTTKNMVAVHEAFEYLKFSLQSMMADVSNSFDQIRDGANDVAKLQRELKSDISAAFVYTESAFDVIQDYQRKTERTLSNILGSSYTKADFWFYGTCIMSLFLMSGLGVSLEKRLYFIAWFGASMVIERSIVSRYGTSAWLVQDIPQFKIYCRRLLALLTVVMAWTKRYYIPTRKSPHTTQQGRNKQAPCVFCSQRPLGVKKGRPSEAVTSLYARKAFSEVIMPTRSFLDDDLDEIQSQRQEVKNLRKRSETLRVYALRSRIGYKST